MPKNLILSLFPGIDMLGMGFEENGFCVVRGPDLITGGDIRNFKPVPNVFGGIIGGPPCQDFSRLRRIPPNGNGLKMLVEFARCIYTAQPSWYLLENVPGVFDICPTGYTVQRMHVRASEFGAGQHRLRIFQFGYRDGSPLTLCRPVTNPVATEPAATATEGTQSTRRGWAEFCRSQGFTEPPILDQFTKAAKYRAVGNGVDLRVSRAIAGAIRARRDTDPQPCQCGCGRPVTERAKYAENSCRKRAQRTRDRVSPGRTEAGSVTCDQPVNKNRS